MSMFETMLKKKMQSEGGKNLVDDLFSSEQVNIFYVLSLVYGMNFIRKSVGDVYQKSWAIVEKMANMEKGFFHVRGLSEKLKEWIDSVRDFTSGKDVKLEFDANSNVISGRHTRKLLNEVLSNVR